MWGGGVTDWYQSMIQILGLDGWNVFVMHSCQCLCGCYACIVMVMVIVHEVIVCH